MNNRRHIASLYVSLEEKPSFFQIITKLATTSAKIVQIIWYVLNFLITFRSSTMEDWKTTVGGIITAIGMALSALDDPPWIRYVGAVLGAIGAMLLGKSAKDAKTK